MIQPIRKKRKKDCYRGKRTDMNVNYVIFESHDKAMKGAMRAMKGT